MHKLLLGIAASSLMVSGALAHSPTPAPVAPAPAPTYNSAAFDWDGFYMGVGIAGISAPSTGVTAAQADLIAGINVTSGNVLFGAEVWVGGATNSVPSSSAELGAAARVGYLVSPEALIYAAGGVQYYINGGGTYATAGGGVEFTVAKDLSLDLEYKYGSRINLIPLVIHSFGASVNWGF